MVPSVVATKYCVAPGTDPASRALVFVARDGPTCLAYESRIDITTLAPSPWGGLAGSKPRPTVLSRLGRVNGFDEGVLGCWPGPRQSRASFGEQRERTALVGGVMA